MKIKTTQSKIYELIFAGSIFDEKSSLINDVQIEDYGFNSKLLRKGLSLLNSWPRDFTIFLEGSEPVDYLICRGLYPLISNRVKKNLENYQLDGVEFLPVNMIYLKKGLSFPPYWVINIYKTLSALDWNNTVWTTSNPKEDPYPHMAIIKPAMYGDIIGNVGVFRLIVKEYVLPNIYISSLIMEKLRESNATIGMEFIPIKCID